MLEILIAGKPLHLPEDISFDLTIENPFCVVDRIPSPYTLTFYLPPTPYNLATLGHPNRVTSTTGFKEYTNCDVLFGGIGFSSGTLKIQEFEGIISAYYQGSVYTKSMRNAIYNNKLQYYEFTRTGSTNRIANGFIDYLALLTNSLIGAEKFVSAPVKITNSGIGISNVTFHNYFHLYFNYYYAKEDHFIYNDSSFSDPRKGINTCGLQQHYFPQPFLWHIFDAIFGDKIISNPFTKVDLNKIVAITSYIPLKEYYNNNTNSISHFYLNDFLANYKANTLLKDLCKMFCATLFVKGNKFEWKYNSDILNDTTVENWDDKVAGDIAVSKCDQQSYTYGYSDFDDEDSVVLVTVDSIDALNSVAFTSTESTEESFKIKNTNQIYKKTKNDDGTFSYEMVSVGLGGVKDAEDGKDAYDMVSDVAPLPQNLEDNIYPIYDEGSYEWTYPSFKWYVPRCSRDNAVGALSSTRSSKVYLMLYQGKHAVGLGHNDYQYGLLTAHNYDHLGNRLGDLSLAWDGADGLLNRYHLPFKAWIEKEKVRLTVPMRLTALDLKMLDMKTRKHIRGKNFFIEKIEVSLKKRSIELANVYFIEG